MFRVRRHGREGREMSRVRVDEICGLREGARKVFRPRRRGRDAMKLARDPVRRVTALGK